MRILDSDSIRLRVALDLYKGRFIEHAFHLRTVEEAEWLATLWRDSTPIGRSRLRTAKIYWPLRRYKVYTPGAVHSIRHPVTWFCKINIYRRGVFKRRLFGESLATSQLVEYLWCSRSSHNTIVVKKYSPSSGWVVEDAWYEESARASIAKLAHLAARSSKRKT